MVAKLDSKRVNGKASCQPIQEELNDNPYFNSGVMLMNLHYWRKYHVTQQLIQFINEHPNRCLYPDQDALNIILDNKVKYLPYSYNYQHYWVVNLRHSKIAKIKHQAIINEGNNPIIIHFCKEKPWWTVCNNPYYREYDYYNKLHSFLGNANHHKKLKLFFFRVCNRLILSICEIRDYLNNM